MHPPATALAQAATALREQAREHKRAEFAHRKKARALLRCADELERICKAHGIHFEAQAKGATAR